VTPARRTRGPLPSEGGSPRAAALRLLARREQSEAQLRARLCETFDTADVEAAIAGLKHEGIVDDRRVAAAHARTAIVVKRRGRLRVARELDAMGIEHGIARDAIESVLGDVDETGQLERELDRRTQGRSLDQRMRARVYGQLVRQGFPPDQVIAALRRRRIDPDAP
jgi:SOS response regulatory protein OraA/RecX